MRLKGLATSKVLGSSTELNVGSANPLTSFEEVKKLDLVNEKMPARKPDTLSGTQNSSARSSPSIQNSFRSSVGAPPPGHTGGPPK